jgi:Skp family chaperone for outer membrane proteins
MYTFRSLLALCFFAVLGSVSVFGQGGARPGAAPARPAATPARTAPAAASVPTPASKVAFINSQVFTDDKQGITRLAAVIAQVNREFKPRQDELQAMQADIAKRTNDLQSLSTSTLVDQTKIAAQAEELERLKKEFTRKGEDGTAAYQKRLNDVTRPYQEEIGRAIDDYASRHGITLVLDASVFAQGVLYFAQGVDITADFIAEFNARPAGTAARPQ